MVPSCRRSPKGKCMSRFGLTSAALFPILVASASGSGRDLPSLAQSNSLGSAAAVSQTTAPRAKESQQLISRYCVGCHNERTKSGGLALDRLNLANVGPDAEHWEKVVKKLGAGMMPPPGMPRPDQQTTRQFRVWLEGELDRMAARSPNPGRTEAYHRLNRAEYQNAIRDLLGVEMDVASQLPADDASYGFDNIAGVLRVSPTLMERYIAVSRKVSRAAVGTPPPFPNFDVFRMPDDLSQDDRLEGLPFGTRGGMVIPYNFPAAGEYLVRVRLGRQLNGQDLDIPRFDHPQNLEISLDGLPVKVFTLNASSPMRRARAAAVDNADRPEPIGTNPWPADPSRRRRTTSAAPAAPPTPVPPPTPPAAAPSGTDSTRPATAAAQQGVSNSTASIAGGDDAQGDRGTLDAEWAVRFHAPTGVHNLQVTFTNPTRALLQTLPEPHLRPYPSGTNQWSNRKGAYLHVVEVSGPFDDKAIMAGPGSILTCRPSGPSNEERCARSILAKLARRGFRRPIDPPTLERGMRAYKEGRKAGSFETGLEWLVQRILVSPEFLFRIESDPPKVAPGNVYKVGDLELASRLSFFLWSSIPDDELLDVAIAKKLSDPAVFDRQVLRMLADRRADAFVENFVGQWLLLRNVPALTSEPYRDPDFDEGLRRAMRTETELFVKSVVREDRSIFDLLTADYTYLNERLAKHYGIPGVSGSRFRRVSVPEGNRRRGLGLLGHSSILAVTSHTNRTAPVVRGKWILENILGTPPPSPPADVPPLDETENVGKPMTMRERMAAHRRNPVCASCHVLMDPLGLALENFDQAGRWRAVDYGADGRRSLFTAIDASGALPDGTKFDGPFELREALLGRGDRFVATLAEKLLTYALGRGVEYYDGPAIRKIVQDASRREYRFSSIVLSLTKSLPFQMRRASHVR